MSALWQLEKKVALWHLPATIDADLGLLRQDSLGFHPFSINYSSVRGISARWGERCRGGSGGVNAEVAEKYTVYKEQTVWKWQAWLTSLPQSCVHVRNSSLVFI